MFRSAKPIPNRLGRKFGLRSPVHSAHTITHMCVACVGHIDQFTMQMLIGSLIWD